MFSLLFPLMQKALHIVLPVVLVPLMVEECILKCISLFWVLTCINLGQILLPFTVEMLMCGLRTSIPFVLILILKQKGGWPVAEVIHYCISKSLQHIF